MRTTRFRFTAGRGAAVAVGAAVLGLSSISATAVAAQAAPGFCSGGDIAAGTYSSFTVTGDCRVPDGATVTVIRNVMVASGARLDASTHSTLSVGRSVLAGPGSSVALGCTEAHPCDDGQPGQIGADTIGRNVILDHVYDAAINGVTVGRNVVSTGGGPGYSMDPWVPYSIKDDTVKGSIIVTGLRTTWFGVIRTDVGRNVVLTDIKAADPDGNEVVADTIGGNLVCERLTPKPQLGDAVEGAPPGYGPSTVRGRAVGQCASLQGPATS